jgi:DNA-binding MarR family transcriptional regulator
MKKTTSLKSYFDLWLLVIKVNHLTMLAWQKEMDQYQIPARQFYLLRVIKDLGAKATLSELAKQVERRVHVVSNQTIEMEKDGLIKRITMPKSRLLKIELTQKGLEIINICTGTKSIDMIFSSLSGEECQKLESILNVLLNKLKKDNSVEY